MCESNSKIVQFLQEFHFTLRKSGKNGRLWVVAGSGVGFGVGAGFGAGAGAGLGAGAGSVIKEI